MKQKDKVKEFFGKLSGKTKKILIAGAAGLVVFAVIVALALNSGEKPEGYAVLFSGLGEQEASEVMAKLQELNIDYQYSPDGSIKVPPETADKTRATLAVEGYPKNGFAYETYLKNSSMMSTESDKKSLKVWDMQDRLQATIAMIDGVKNAVVQISPGETQRYVLDDDAQTVPTASVLVNMKDGSSPEPKVVEGIQRLVSKSVANMDMGDVVVIDGNGVDVSVRKNDSGTLAGDDKLDFERKYQLLVEENILKLLEAQYGRNNVRVSVKCTADMKKTVSEEIGYTAPNVDNNSGYISHQELTAENDGGTAVGGIPGAQTNTNLPQYNTQPQAGAGYSNSSSSTDYELNQSKVQSQYDGGNIVDLSVAISINTDNLGVSKDDLTAQVARAAGIDPTVQADKIVIVNSLWPTYTVEAETTTGPDDGPGGEGDKNKYLPLIIGAGIGLVVLLFIIVLLGVRRSKKKAKAAMEAAMAVPEVPENVAAAVEAAKEKYEIPVVVDEKSLAMRENIKEFAEENPEISAQLLKNWLGGEDND